MNLLATPCPHCGAQENAVCVTASGKEVHEVHSARWHAAERLARAAFHLTAGTVPR